MAACQVSLSHVLRCPAAIGSALNGGSDLGGSNSIVTGNRCHRRITILRAWLSYSKVNVYKPTSEKAS